MILSLEYDQCRPTDIRASPKVKPNSKRTATRENIGFYQPHFVSVQPSHKVWILLTYLAAYLDINLCSSSILELDNKKACSRQLGTELPLGIVINIDVEHEK